MTPRPEPSLNWFVARAAKVSVEVEYLVELVMEAGRRIGHRVDEDPHGRLPAGVDVARRKVRLEPGKVFDLQVAEEVVAALEDRVVVRTRCLELGEHLGPDSGVPSPVLVLAAG